MIFLRAGPIFQGKRPFLLFVTDRNDLMKCDRSGNLLKGMQQKSC
jgi:hypothetical protein